MGAGNGMLAVVAVGDAYTDREIDAVLPQNFNHRNPGNLVIAVRKRLGHPAERGALPELLYTRPS